MPSFNVSLPQIPKRFDLRDVTDPIDRKLEIAEQAASLLTSTLHDLTHGADGVLLTGTGAGKPFPAPGYITTENVAYETAIATALAGAVAALDALKGVSSLT